MSKKEIEAWWNDITSDESALMIGYRVTPRKAAATNPAPPAKRKRTTASRPARVARK